jgi:hypothetical protein
MFQSLPTYSSMLPPREQLKEKTAINLKAERNTWMLFYHLNVERDAKYVFSSFFAFPPPLWFYIHIFIMNQNRPDG